jgi:hypothetical protein
VHRAVEARTEKPQAVAGELDAPRFIGEVAKRQDLLA